LSRFSLPLFPSIITFLPPSPFFPSSLLPLSPNTHPIVSAHDPKAPYYDASSSSDSPKWSLVHVVFRQKLATPITLKELRAWYGEKDNPLNGMEMLRLARLSVSKVSEGEWRFLVEEMGKRGDVIDES
jgi:predicted RNA-binding protein with PUA-like domain